MQWQQHFKPCDNGTILIYNINFTTPATILGKMLNYFYLSKQIDNCIKLRAHKIKKTAEGQNWKTYLHDKAPAIKQYE